MRITWTPVSDNSSSIDAVVSLVRGSTFNYCDSLVWDPRVKAIFRQLRAMGYKKARERARGWCRRNLASF